jgi:hypothetical protein
MRRLFERTVTSSCRPAAGWSPALTARYASNLSPSVVGAFLIPTAQTRLCAVDIMACLVLRMEIANLGPVAASPAASVSPGPASAGHSVLADAASDDIKSGDDSLSSPLTGSALAHSFSEPHSPAVEQPHAVPSYASAPATDDQVLSAPVSPTPAVGSLSPSAVSADDVSLAMDVSASVPDQLHPLALPPPSSLLPADPEPHSAGEAASLDDQSTESAAIASGPVAQALEPHALAAIEAFFHAALSVAGDAELHQSALLVLRPLLEARLRLSPFFPSSSPPHPLVAQAWEGTTLMTPGFGAVAPAHAAAALLHRLWPQLEALALSTWRSVQAAALWVIAAGLNAPKAYWFLFAGNPVMLTSAWGNSCRVCWQRCCLPLRVRSAWAASDWRHLSSRQTVWAQSHRDIGRMLTD